MRTNIAIASFLTVAAGAMGANALSGVTNLRGSDTLFEVTNDVISQYNAANPGAPLTSVYTGGGSSTGQSQLIAATPTQTISPMSRAMNNGICSVPATAGSTATAEGIVIGLDGLSIVGDIDTSASAACNGAADPDDGVCPAADNTVGLAGAGKAITYTPTGGSPTTYNFTDWRDVLRLVYAGADNTMGNNANLRQCNGPLRRAVVDNWGNLFANNCAGTSCTQLRHAFRRDDSSGTSDVFVTLLNLGSINVAGRSNPFCNTTRTGAGETNPAIGVYQPDFQDNDPIRRSCAGTNAGTPPSTTTATEQVCSRLGNLGVVLPIPPVDNLSQANAYPTAACALGTFKLGAAPRNATGAVQRCPNGDSAVFGTQCLVPVDASNNAGCLNARTNRPICVGDCATVDGMKPNAPTMDARVYNLHLYAASGSYQVDIRNRAFQGAFHRIHSTRTLNTPDTSVNACQQLDATEQIGCLAQASPCSIGYAGREAAVYPAGGTPLVGGIKVSGRPASRDCVLSLEYVVSRKLYLNTVAGFENVTGDELIIAQQMSTASFISPILTANGFVALPNPTCEDFNEQSLCSAAANVNACANNVAPIPQ